MSVNQMRKQREALVSSMVGGKHVQKGICRKEVKKAIMCCIGCKTIRMEKSYSLKASTIFIFCVIEMWYPSSFRFH